MVSQNKNLISLWYEAKDNFNKEMRKFELLTTKEIEDYIGTEYRRQFFDKNIKIFQRWMKVLTREEGDILSPMIIDQLYKTLFIFIDKILNVRDR